MKFSFRRAVVGLVGLAALLAIAYGTLGTVRAGHTAPLSPAAAAAQSREGFAPIPGAMPDTFALHPIPFMTADTGRGQLNVQTGAYHGVPVPSNFTGTPANTPAAYSGPTLTVRSTYIGREAAEPTIGVDRQGNAFMTASTFDSPGGVAARTLIYRSTDDNLTWQPKSPSIANSTDPAASLDPYVYVDPTTDRVYSGDLAGAGIQFMWTDNKGDTWTRGSPVQGDAAVDHQTFIAAKPVSPFTPVGYANLFYFCSNRVGESACSRSLDGGISFVSSGAPAYPGASGSTVCGGLTGHMVSDSAGRLFLPRFYCGLSLAPPAVSISSDGGVTWTIVQINSYINMPHHEVGIAVDKADNVYAVWWDATRHLPYLSTSTDHGMHWSTPRMVAPPGVYESNFPTITAGDAGRIALNFPGTTVNSQSTSTRPWNEYVVVSTNALTSDPLFVYTTANDVADPVHRGTCVGRCSGMWDFLAIKTSPKDGRFWATEADDCTGTCVTGSGGVTQVGQGVAISQTGGPSLVKPPTAVKVASFGASKLRSRTARR